MKKFIKNFKEALDIEEVEVMEDTILEEIEEWDSVGYISTMAMIDEEYDQVVSANNLKKCKSVSDIFNLIEK